MISEKSSTLFALVNIRLTRSQRRGIEPSPPGSCVWACAVYRVLYERLSLFISGLFDGVDKVDRIESLAKQMPGQRIIARQALE